MKLIFGGRQFHLSSLTLRDLPAVATFLENPLPPFVPAANAKAGKPLVAADLTDEDTDFPDEKKVSAKEEGGEDEEEGDEMAVDEPAASAPKSPPGSAVSPAPEAVKKSSRGTTTSSLNVAEEAPKAPLVAVKIEGQKNEAAKGKKVVIIKQVDDGTKDRPYPHAIVAGIERYPRKVTKRMGKKTVARRSKVKPFIKVRPIVTS